MATFAIRKRAARTQGAGTLLPGRFDTYEAAEAGADRIRSHGLWACVEQLPPPDAVTAEPSAPVRLDGIAHYLDRRTEATILAALRHLAQTIRSGSDAMSLDVEEIMSAGGLFAEMGADEIDAFGDALSSDTWLCQTATAPAEA